MGTNLLHKGLELAYSCILFMKLGAKARRDCQSQIPNDLNVGEA